MTEVVVNTVEYYTELYKNKNSVELKKTLASSKDEFWNYNSQIGMGDRMTDRLHEIVAIDNLLKQRGD